MLQQQEIEMTKATHQELNNAKAALQRYGFEVNFHENGHLVVQDPVYYINAMTGTLKFDYYKPVVIRSYDAARRFISARV